MFKATSQKYERSFLGSYLFEKLVPENHPLRLAGTPYTRHRFSDIIRSIWATQNTTIAFQAM